MKISKNTPNKPKKIVAELYTSFSKGEKVYSDYIVGTITYEGGEYTCTPSPTDDGYDEERKKAILEGILEETILLYGYSEDEKPIEKTKEDPDFLESYSAMRSNMYGGLSIIDATDEDKKVAELDSEKAPEPPESKLTVLKNKKLTLPEPNED